MVKRKVLIAVHQLNLGGVQKALISVLNAIDYNKNDVTLYIRKDRVDLLDDVNENVSKIIINKDKTKYYRKPYSIMLMVKLKLAQICKKDTSKIQQKLNDYVVSQQMKYEKEHCFSDNTEYDVAVSYIQSHTAKFVCDNINAQKKVVFYHGSTDEFHSINEYVMERIDSVYCVSKGAMQAVKVFYPQFADKIDYVDNFVDYKKIRQDAKAFDPEYEKDKLIICSCGRMTKVKGFDLAVKSAKILKDNGVDFKWYFVGDGVERVNIEVLISERNLNDNIVITGLVNNPYPYINNCDIYVNPSYEEAHPLSIIEAHIMGSMVVATATVGGQAVVSNMENGVISEINEASIAEKIMLLKSDEALQRRIKDNLIKKDYEDDYKIFCEKWEKLLEE